MDGEDLPELLGWLIDCAAAAIAGGAAGWCLWLFGQDVPLAALVAASIAVATCGVLRAWGSAGRRFRLPAFELPSWGHALAAEPLLLDQPLDGAKIVCLAVPRANVRGHHPAGGEVVPFAPDASAALKAAPAELRRAH